MEKVLYGWANSDAYLEHSETSKMELFMRIINDWKQLTISLKPFHHAVITYIQSEPFYLSIFWSSNSYYHEELHGRLSKVPKVYLFH